MDSCPIMFMFWDSFISYDVNDDAEINVESRGRLFNATFLMDSKVEHIISYSPYTKKLWYLGYSKANNITVTTS